MKKILTLLCSVLFLSFCFFLFLLTPESTQTVFADQSSEIEEVLYEIDLQDDGVNTNNLHERFPNIVILRAYPMFSSIYEERINQKYYNFDTTLPITENCAEMQNRYLFLLNHYGFIHDKQEYEIHGLPLSKILVWLDKNQINDLKKTYSIQEKTV